ncbi:MAG: ROK family protein [Candidatus Peregrinibacteria bacterium]
MATNILAGDIHGGHARAGVVYEEDGRLILDESTFTHIGSKDNTNLGDVLSASFDQAKRKSKRIIGGVAVDVASPIDGISIVKKPPNVACLKKAAIESGSTNLNLQEILQGRYAVQAAVYNDLQAEAAGVTAMGLLGNPPPEDYLYENGGTGYGGARTQKGRTSAAEPGHVTLSSGGIFVPLCGCGREGCAEAYVGSDYVADRVRQICRAKLIEITECDPNVFADKQAKKGEQWAVKHLCEVARTWGGLWRNLLQQYPAYKKILVTGSYLRAVLEIPAFLAEVRNVLKESSFPETFGQIPIEAAPMPEYDKQPIAPMIGAAHLLLQYQHEQAKTERG